VVSGGFVWSFFLIGHILASPDWSDSDLNVEMDLELQKEYFMATLDVFKKLYNWFKRGLWIYVLTSRKSFN